MALVGRRNKHKQGNVIMSRRRCYKTLLLLRTMATGARSASSNPWPQQRSAQVVIYAPPDCKGRGEASYSGFGWIGQPMANQLLLVADASARGQIANRAAGQG